MTVVLDTNVLLAAFATHGLCESIVTLCFRDHTVVMSQHIADEIERHFGSKFKASPAEVAEALVLLREHCWWVVPSEVPCDACADPDDLPALGTAIAGKAESLVTGDKQLLSLREYQGVSIVTPRAFYERRLA